MPTIQTRESARTRDDPEADTDASASGPPHLRGIARWVPGRSGPHNGDARRARHNP